MTNVSPEIVVGNDNLRQQVALANTNMAEITSMYGGHLGQIVADTYKVRLTRLSKAIEGDRSAVHDPIQHTQEIFRGIAICKRDPLVWLDDQINKTRREVIESRREKAAEEAIVVRGKAPGSRFRNESPSFSEKHYRKLRALEDLVRTDLAKKARERLMTMQTGNVKARDLVIDEMGRQIASAQFGEGELPGVVDMGEKAVYERRRRAAEAVRSLQRAAQGPNQMAGEFRVLIGNLRAQMSEVRKKWFIEGKQQTGPTWNKYSTLAKRLNNKFVMAEQQVIANQRVGIT